MADRSQRKLQDMVLNTDLPFPEVIASGYNRAEYDPDSDIIEFIESTGNYRAIPFITSDSIRRKCYERYREEIEDTPQNMDFTKYLLSFRSEPERLNALLNEVKEKIPMYKGKDEFALLQTSIAMVISSFESVNLRIQLMDILVHRRYQGIIMGSLHSKSETKEEKEEIDKKIEKWAKESMYSSEKAEEEMQKYNSFFEGDGTLYCCTANNGNTDWITNEELLDSEKNKIIELWKKVPEGLSTNCIKSLDDLDDITVNRILNMRLELLSENEEKTSSNDSTIGLYSEHIQKMQTIDAYFHEMSVREKIGMKYKVRNPNYQVNKEDLLKE